MKNRRERGLSAPEQVDGPSTPAWDARWGFPDLHTVVLGVQGPDGKITAYEYKQAVKEPQEILDGTFDQIPKYNYPGFRGGLEVKHLEIAQNGVSDQKFGIPHITSTAPNPAKAPTVPDYPSVTYSAVASPNTKSYRCYVKPENWDWTNLARNYNFNGYPRAQFQGQDLLSLGSNSNSTNWLIASPGAYTIICEELDAAGQPLGTVARYLQVLQAAERLNQTEQFREYLGRVESSIDKIAKDREIALRAVHLNTETSQSMGLALFVGPDARDPKQIKLLDLTPGASRIEYGGADIEKAIDNFADDNSYPKGLIQLEIPGDTKSHTIETDGQSLAGGVASKLGWASLGLTGLGLVALVTPGAQVAVPYLFLGAAAAGGVSSVASIANELQQAKPNGRQIAIDILGLASSLAGGGAASLALRGSGRELVQSVAGRFLIYTGFTSDVVAGVLLTFESADQINQIVNTEGMSRSEKVTAIVRILSFLAINYGLIDYSAKDVDLLSGNSAKQTSETGTNGLQNDPAVRPGQTSFNPLPPDSPRLQELTNALPEKLRNDVTIFEDSTASGSTVRVYYEPKVKIGVGPAARAADIELHVRTVQLLLRYSGLLGKIRPLN